MNISQKFYPTMISREIPILFLSQNSIQTWRQNKQWRNGTTFLSSWRTNTQLQKRS